VRQHDIVPIWRSASIAPRHTVAIDDWVKEHFSFRYLHERDDLEKPFGGLDIIVDENDNLAA
jgi:hypothetical protein